MFLRLFVFFHDIFGTQIRSQLGFPALRLPDLRFRFFQLTLSSNDSNSGLNWSCVINRRIGIVAVGGTQRSRAFTARQEIVWDLSGSISYFFPKLSRIPGYGWPPGDMLWCAGQLTSSKLRKWTVLGERHGAISSAAVCGRVSWYEPCLSGRACAISEHCSVGFDQSKFSFAELFFKTNCERNWFSVL